MTVLLKDGRNDLMGAFRHVLDAFLTDDDLARGIFIKPNIVFPVKTESREITPLTFISTLIAALRARRSDVDIVIGEGVAAGCDPQENFRVSGYADLARELHIPLVDLHEAERQTVPWKFGKLQLPLLALERTYINLPLLKPSSACVISGALKNQKGLVPPEMKKHFHRLGLHEQIAELNVMIKPALTIMDCSNFFGRNSIMAGNNCGEIDSTACRLLDIDEPEHVQLARSMGVFADGFAVEGGTFDTSRAPHPEMKESKSIGRLRLWSNPQACTMCRYLFRGIQLNLLKRHNALAAAKLAPYALKGAEIIMGLNAQWRKEHDTVICIGTCTRRVAREGGYIHIPGCPPTPEDIYKYLP